MSQLIAWSLITVGISSITFLLQLQVTRIQKNLKTIASILNSVTDITANNSIAIEMVKIQLKEMGK
jgi:hypothetical protein